MPEDAGPLDQPFDELMPEMRPQDPGLNGNGWWFQTSEHGGSEPDTMPQSDPSARIRRSVGSGEQMQVDSARQPPISVFVATLGWSRASYVDLEATCGISIGDKLRLFYR